MARNQSLPTHLQEKDSRGKENLTLYEHHENPPSGDQGLAFQTHALQMILFGPFYVRPQTVTVRYEIVSLQKVMYITSRARHGKPNTL